MKKRRLFFVYCKLLEIEKLIVSKIILNTTSFEYSIKNIVINILNIVLERNLVTLMISCVAVSHYLYWRDS